MAKAYRIFILSSTAIALSGALSGCFHHDISLQDGYGNAVKQNMAAQVVNPAPQYEGPALSSGARGAVAMERYNTDKVEKPAQQRTTTVGASSGGGGKGGS